MFTQLCNTHAKQCTIMYMTVKAKSHWLSSQSIVYCKIRNPKHYRKKQNKLQGNIITSLQKPTEHCEELKLNC